MCQGSFTLLCCFMKITSFYGETNCTECVIWKCNLRCHMDQGISFPMQCPIATPSTNIIRLISLFQIISNIEDRSLSVFLGSVFKSRWGGRSKENFFGMARKISNQQYMGTWKYGGKHTWKKLKFQHIHLYHCLGSLISLQIFRQFYNQLLDWTLLDKVQIFGVNEYKRCVEETENQIKRTGATWDKLPKSTQRKS